MIYRIFHPIPALSDLVDHYWYSKVELTESALQTYATPLLQGLVFNFSRQPEYHTFNGRTMTLDRSVYLFGQPLSPRVAKTNAKGIDILGVKFKPLGISRLTGINMDLLADQIVDAEAIWGRRLEPLLDEMQSARSLEQRIDVLEVFLLRMYLSTKSTYRIESVQGALDLITRERGCIDVKALQQQTNTSRKTLERAFVNFLGVHPKVYTRIVRFNAIKSVLDHAGPQNLTSLALDFGYYDSSHFIAEFKTFSALTPQAYLKSNPLKLVVKDEQ